jgi:hemolysin III
MVAFPAPRPMLRGYVHLAAAALAPLAFWLLMINANSPRDYVGAAIFGSAITLMFATSAAYHLLPAGPRIRGILQGADHAMIFVGIGGIYTPFCLQVLGLAWGISLLSVVWGLVAAGIVLRRLVRMPGWAVALTYLAVGWTALVGVPELVGNLGPAASVKLLVAGGVYSAGAAVYALKRPDPAPRFFGHHEVFHSLVTAATAGMYLIVLTDVMPR